MAVSLVWLDRPHSPFLNCRNNLIAGFPDLQPLLFRFSWSFARGPPALGLTDTKHCNLIASSETKDPFSIPSSKEALHGAEGSFSPPVSLPWRTLTPHMEAPADSARAVSPRAGHADQQQASEQPPSVPGADLEGDSTPDGLTQREHGGPRTSVNSSCQHGQNLMLQEARGEAESGQWGQGRRGSPSKQQIVTHYSSLAALWGAPCRPELLAETPVSWGIRNEASWKSCAE